MPQKGYANITVKAPTFQRFTREKERAVKADPSVDNSGFLEMLLDGRAHPVPSKTKIRGLPVSTASTSNPEMPPSPEEIVRKIADTVNARGWKYGVSEKSIHDAITLLNKVRDAQIMRDRRPNTIAAWALYRSCKENRDNISQKAIASAAEIADRNFQYISGALEDKGG